MVNATNARSKSMIEKIHHITVLHAMLNVQLKIVCTAEMVKLTNVIDVKMDLMISTENALKNAKITSLEMKMDNVLTPH